MARLVILTFDHSVIEGARDKETQDKYFRDGVSHLKWPNSKHNVTEDQPKSDAIDVWPYTARWKALSGHPDQIARIATQIKKSNETLAQAQIRARSFVFKSFARLAGHYEGVASVLGYTLRWGGDWDRDGDLLDQSFFDLPHLEIVRPS